jgi:hypothetical protein
VKLDADRAVFLTEIDWDLNDIPAAINEVYEVYDEVMASARLISHYYFVEPIKNQGLSGFFKGLFEMFKAM